MANEELIQGEGGTLSTYFSLQHEGEGRNAHVDIYVRTADGEKEYVGSTSTRGSGFGGSGEQMSNLAISEDGRSVAFRHYSVFAKGRSKQESGIYHYKYGEGGRLLHRSENLPESWTVWGKPIPKDILVFHVSGGPEMALSAEGREFPLALLEGTALHQAAYEGRTAEVEALLEAGEPIDSQTYWGDTALGVALMRRNDEAAIRLVESGANLELGPNPALHVAAFNGSLSALEAMARRGANINVLDSRRNSALQVALTSPSANQMGYRDLVFGGDDTRRSWQLAPQIVIWLLENGADPNARNIEGTTALHRLADSWVDSQGVEAAHELLENGADPNLTDAHGNTPLHLLVADTRTCNAGEGAFAGKPAQWRQSARYQFLALLVAGMRDVNVRNAIGQTPLELALLNRNELSPQFLIDHGANASLRTKNGLTLGELLEENRAWWKDLCSQ